MKIIAGQKSSCNYWAWSLDIFAGAFFILLSAWEAIMAAFSLCGAVIAFSLFGSISPWSLIPNMPRLAEIVFGLSLSSLSVLTAVGCIYLLLLFDNMRSYRRFHENTIAIASGRGILPTVTISPKISSDLIGDFVLLH